MTARRKVTRPATVTFDDTLRHSTRLRGPVRVLTPELRRLGIPWQWDARDSAFLVPKGRADDVLAALEEVGHRVEVVGASLW